MTANMMMAFSIILKDILWAQDKFAFNLVSITANQQIVPHHSYELSGSNKLQN